MRIDIAGLTKTLAGMAAATDHAVDSMEQALYLEAEYLMTESKQQVPHDTGTLQASGTVLEPIQTPNGEIAVQLGYGGLAESYAMEQHENTALSHPKGRKAKYLSDPYEALVPNLDNKIAAHMRKSGVV